VTRGDDGAKRLISRRPIHGNPQRPPCRNNYPFSNNLIYPWRLRLSRNPRRVGNPASRQTFGSAITRGGPTTSPRGYRSVSQLHSSEKQESFPCCNNESSLIGTVWIPNRWTPVRTPRVHLASMCQSWSVVFKTPLPATASRVDLNTYRIAGRESKLPKRERCRA